MSKHFRKRMSQRGITQEIIELVLSFGYLAGDKRILDRRALENLIIVLDEMRSKAIRALDKGGITVVEADGQLITTYAGGHR